MKRSRYPLGSVGATSPCAMSLPTVASAFSGLAMLRPFPLALRSLSGKTFGR